MTIILTDPLAITFNKKDTPGRRALLGSTLVRKYGRGLSMSGELGFIIQLDSGGARSKGGVDRLKIS